MAIDYSRSNEKWRDKMGEAVTYTPAGGDPTTIKAIVNRSYAFETGGVGIQSEKLVLKVVDADVDGIATGDGFTISAVDYLVVEIMPDFSGMSDIVLNKA